jgi:HEAT repeat protein
MEKENTDLAPKVFDALVKLGRSSAYPLGELLQNEDKDIRLGAANALGRLGSEAASSLPVRNLLLQHASRDPDPAVRKAAAEAISMIWH